MEADAILKMVEYAFRHHFFIIDVIVSNYDSTIQAVLKHPSRGAQGQFLKSPKGKLYEEITVPSFLVDLTYRVKVVAKRILSIVNDGMAQQCGCAKSDALRLNMDSGIL